MRILVKALLEWRQKKRHSLSPNLLEKKDSLIRQYERDYKGDLDACLSDVISFCEDAHQVDQVFTDEDISQFKTRISDLDPGYIRRGLRLGALDSHEELFFAVCSLFKNLEVLEIGVANGYSSAMFYEALSKKGSGSIVSIDKPIFEDEVSNKSSLVNLLKGRVFELLATWAYPDEASRPSYLWRGGVVPSSKYSGWLVDAEKRFAVDSRLFIGDAFAVLKTIKFKKFNIILLDAMKDEQDRLDLLEAVYPFLAESGIIIQDGAWRNNAASIFADRHLLKYLEIGRVALIRN